MLLGLNTFFSSNVINQPNNMILMVYSLHIPPIRIALLYYSPKNDTYFIFWCTYSTHKVIAWLYYSVIPQKIRIPLMFDRESSKNGSPGVSQKRAASRTMSLRCSRTSSKWMMCWDARCGAVAITCSSYPLSGGSSQPWNMGKVEGFCWGLPWFTRFGSYIYFFSDSDVLRPQKWKQNENFTQYIMIVTGISVGYHNEMSTIRYECVPKLRSIYSLWLLTDHKHVFQPGFFP